MCIIQRSRTKRFSNLNFRNFSAGTRQRHYLYTEIDEDGDANTKKAAWYQVIAWKSQHSNRWTLGIQHDRIREGDEIAVAPQLSMPLVKECYVNCDPVLGMSLFFHIRFEHVYVTHTN